MTNAPDEFDLDDELADTDSWDDETPQADPYAEPDQDAAQKSTISK